MARPLPGEYAPHFENYLSYVPEPEILPVLREDLATTISFLKTISEQDSLIKHAPYTWSTREVVGHVIDAERVFAYRALRFARGDQTPLPGFEENDYALAAEHDQRSLVSLIAELEAVRLASCTLFEGLPLDPDCWSRSGLASNLPISVRTLAYIIAGHLRHHLTILRKRFV